MAIQFVFVGTSKVKEYKSLEAHYAERVGHHVSVDLVHVKDSKEKDVGKRNAKEGELILKKIPPQNFVCVCDESGKTYDSVLFSENIQGTFDQGRDITFVVGGAYGLSDDVLNRADVKLKLAPWTLPHELARVVLTEQVYRAFAIHKKTGYHH